MENKTPENPEKLLQNGLLVSGPGREGMRVEADFLHTPFSTYIPHER